MASLYTGSRSRHEVSDFLTDRFPDEPKPEISIAYAGRGVGKLLSFLRANSVGHVPLNEMDCGLILNLLVRQLPANAPTLVESGTLTTVFGFLSHPAQVCRYETARILKGCMHIGRAVETVLACDVLATMFTLIGDSRESEQSRVQLAQACSIACMHPSVQRSLSCNTPHLDLLIRGLRVTPTAVDSVACLAGSTCAEAILSLHGEAGISALLASGSEEQRFQALTALRALATLSDESKAAVLNTGCMPHVLACLSDTSSAVRCAAVGTLSLLVLVLAGTHAAMSAAPESVWALVKLTHDGSPVTATTASRAIRTLIHTKDGRGAFLKALLMDARTLAAVMEHRAASDLVELLRQGSCTEEQKRASLTCLLHLAELGEESLESIANSPGIASTLRSLMQDPSSPLYEDSRQLAMALAAAFADMANAWPELTIAQ